MTTSHRFTENQHEVIAKRTDLVPAHPLADPLARIGQALPAEVLANMDPELARLVQSSTTYAANSRAGSTRENYGRYWTTFDAWTNGFGLESLPAQPEVVALYAAHLADTGGHGLRIDGNSAGRRPGTVSNHLVAIRAVHVDAGYGDPTAHPAVRKVLSGIKRTKGTRVRPRHPMTYELLERVVFAIDARHELRAALDKVVLAAAGTQVAGQWISQPDRSGSITASQLSAASWQQVLALSEDHAVVQLASRSNRKGTTVELVIAARPGDPLCFVDALRSMLQLLRDLTVEARRQDGFAAGQFADTVRTTWQASTGAAGLAGPLLPRLDKTGLPVNGVPTRQYLENRARRAGEAAGLDVAGTPDAWSSEDRHQALVATQHRSLGDTRDRCLLLVGWHLAARRSNLTWLRVGEVSHVPGGLDVTFRRSKTDQEQHGRELVVPAVGGRFCPVDAWDTWYEAMARQLGLGLHANWPAFPPITKDGTAVDQPREVFEKVAGAHVVGAVEDPVSLGLEGLGGDAINHMVKARARQAGLKYDEYGRALPWGAHSLRRGWLTEGARQGIGLAELMAHSGHLSHESVLLYIQAANRWSTANSAPLKMRYDLRSRTRTGPTESA